MASPVIPSVTPFVVLLDSNAAITVLESRTRAAELIEWTRRGPIVLFVPALGLPEILPSRQVNEVRLRGLGQLRKALGDRIQVAADLNAMLIREQHHRPTGVLPDLRFDLNSLSEPTADAIVTASIEYAALANRWRQRRLEVFRLERLAAESLRGQLPTHGREPGEEVVEIIDRRVLLSAEDPILWHLREQRILRRPPAEIASQARRFPTVTLLAHLVFRTGIANAVGYDPRRPKRLEGVLGLFRTKSAKKKGEGSTTDNAIAACATLSDLLITDDNDLRRKCAFLRERGLLKFRTATLGEVTRH